MSAWLAVLMGATAPIVLERVTMFVPLVVRVGKEGIAATGSYTAVPSAAAATPCRYQAVPQQVLGNDEPGVDRTDFDPCDQLGKLVRSRQQPRFVLAERDREDLRVYGAVHTSS